MRQDRFTPTSASRFAPKAWETSSGIRASATTPASDRHMADMMAVARMVAPSMSTPDLTQSSPPSRAWAQALHPPTYAITPAQPLPAQQHAPEPSPQSHQPIRVLEVDDQILLRNGIQFSLLAFPDIEVVGQAGSGEEALELCAELHPDVVLMDVIMPGMGGVAAISAIHERWPEIQVVALTSYQDGSLVEETLQAGAIGYLLKDVTVDDLAKAIRLAQRGMPTLSAGAAQSLVQMVAVRPPKIGQDLSERERQVLDLLAAGASNQQIAEQLVITLATVKFHVRSIRSKLGTSSRTETVVLALQHHLVSK